MPCIALYGVPHQQEERPPALLLHRPECPCRRPAPHRATDLSGHRRALSRPGQRAHRSPSPLRQRPATSVCPELCGGPLRIPASGRCWRPCGPRRARVRPPPIICLLAAMHRICQPGPKTEVADGYRSTILQPLWTFSPEHFRSQDFWDALDRIRVEADPGGGPDELEEAQL